MLVIQQNGGQKKETEEPIQKSTESLMSSIKTTPNKLSTIYQERKAKRTKNTSKHRLKALAKLDNDMNVFSDSENASISSSTCDSPISLKSLDNDMNLCSGSDSESDTFVKKTPRATKNQFNVRKTDSSSALKTSPNKISRISKQTHITRSETKSFVSKHKTNGVVKHSTTSKKLNLTVINLEDDDDFAISASQITRKPETVTSPKKPVLKVQLNSPKNMTLNIIKPAIEFCKNNHCEELQDKINPNLSHVCRNIFNSPSSSEFKTNLDKDNKRENVDFLSKYEIKSSCFDNKSPEKLNLSTTKESPKKSPYSSPTKSPLKQLTLTDFSFSSNIKYLSVLSEKTNTNEIVSNKVENNKKSSMYTPENHKRVCENVRKIVSWVFSQTNICNLISNHETNILNNLFKLNDLQHLVLCIRLFTRQQKWYNLNNLCKELNLYHPATKMEDVLSTLAKDYVDADYSDESIETLLEYLTLPQIKDICSSFKLKLNGKKNDLIKALIDHSKRQFTLTLFKRSDEILRDRVTEKLGICVKLKPDVRNILHRVHLLYSLTNSDLESPNDIYNKINEMRTINNEFQRATLKVDYALIFCNRNDFLEYEKARSMKTEMDFVLEKKDLSKEFLICTDAYERLTALWSNDELIKMDQKKPLFLRKFSAAWVYCKILSYGAQNLGKHHPNEVCYWLSTMLDQTVYCAYKRGQWYTQLSVIKKTHLKDACASVRYLMKGLSDQLVSEVSKHELSIRASKVKKGNLPQMLYDGLRNSVLPTFEPPVSRTIQATVVHNVMSGRKLQFIRNTADGKEYGSVEQTAINYYISEDVYTNGVHCEGRILTTLFYVLFWDILIDMQIPNVFITEIQHLPLDLFSTEFYSNRTDEINTRVDDIRDNWTYDTLCQFITDMCERNPDDIMSMIKHDFEDISTVHTLVRCIGKRVLAAVCFRFAKDFTQYRSGLPDLFLWNKHELKSCFVEVKSEKDKLSTNQILWINYLNNNGAKVEVCYVQNVGSRVRR